MVQLRINWRMKSANTDILLSANTLPYRILVVDDLAINRMLIRIALQSLDYFVTEAVNGTHALEWLNKECFDVVLLDVNMPDMNGFDVCRKIRRHQELRQLSVILLMIPEDQDDVVYVMDAGATDYLVKPFDVKELHARVKVAAEYKRALDHLDEAM
jgi:PleD family two-component response regulator